MLSLKVEIMVDIPIQIMFIMLYEINFWNHWMPFVKKTKEVFFLFAFILFTFSYFDLFLIKICLTFIVSKSP